jgi:peroxiredoxin
MKNILVIFLITTFFVCPGFSVDRYIDLGGQSCQPLKVVEGKRANVLCFTTIDCPIANGYSQRFNQLNEKYSSLGYDFYLVHIDWETTKEKARIHQQDYDLKLKVVLDPKHKLVKATGVSMTPEVAVVLPSGDIAYRGRIDNWYEGFGKKRNVINRTELLDALEALLNHQKVPVQVTKAVGCSIPDLPSEN